MREINVEYLLTNEEVDRLEALVPYYQNYKAPDGTYPFKDWNSDKLFQAFMTAGCKVDISDRMEFEERRQALQKTEEAAK